MNKPLVTTIAGLILLTLLAVWGYSAYKHRQMRNEVLGLLKQTSERMRAGLKAEAAARDANPPAFDYVANSAAAENPVLRLRSMDTSSMRELADAADDYLLTAREILRRQANMHDARERVLASAPKLSEHIRTDRGAAAWVNEAAQLRQALEKDLRDNRIAAESYASLLDKFPASQARITPHVDAGLLIDQKTVQAAREAALAAYASAEQNVKQVTNLETYRGGNESTPQSRRAR